MTQVKTAAVGRHTDILLFSAAGVHTVSADTAADALHAVRQLAKAGAQVIFLTENFAAELEPELARYRENAYPIVLPVPTKESRGAYSMQKINANMEKALGTNIFNNE